MTPMLRHVQGWNRLAGVVLASALLVVPVWSKPAPDPPLDLSESQRFDWTRFWEEQRAIELMVALSRDLRPGPLALVGVNIVPMNGDQVLPDRTVIVRNGRISAIGPASELEPPPGANVITPTGYYLLPGLTESHAHTLTTVSQYLVYLSRGVTTVREMDGFPWMLKAREEARRNQLLIPNLYVAGHILSNRAFEFFMTQVDSPEQVRDLVRQQARDGYDFIKIHNHLPEPLFGAVFGAAAEVGLDVAGHIPIDISVRRAIEAGLRTNEHFKSYLYDPTLEITDEDYVAATKGSGLWNVPTFTTYRSHLRGAESRKVMENDDSLRLVPRWMRTNWEHETSQPLDEQTKLRQTIFPKSKKIFSDLLPVTERFLAGTDTGGYPLMVPGYTLHEEIRIFEDLGMPPYQALKTATCNPAIAMRQENEHGTIEVGKRADFIILTKNPLEGTQNLDSIWGVSLRGTWLHKDAIHRITDGLEEIFSERTPVPSPSRGEFVRLVSDLDRLAKDGFPYPGYFLSDIEKFMTDLGETKLAEKVARIRGR